MNVIDMATWPRKSQFEFLSCLPWMNFTALTNPNGGPDDCIPRISWGKLDGQGSNWTIPVDMLGSRESFKR